MLVHNGRLTVTGGVQADGSLLGDSEEFDGRRYIGVDVDVDVNNDVDDSFIFDV